MKNFIVGCIRLYRRWISPVIPGTCRFYPTCSAYAVEAVERRGVIEGLALTFRRLLKCHPWNPGGYDPVPDGEKFLKPKFHIPSSR